MSPNCYRSIISMLFIIIISMIVASFITPVHGATFATQLTCAINSAPACGACAVGTASTDGLSCKPITCNIAFVPANGIANADGTSGTCSTTQQFGSSCVLACKAGFVLTGAPITCGSGYASTFTTPQTCQPIVCAAPLMTSLNIVGSGATPCSSTTSLAFGASCGQQCATGFISNSTSTVSVKCSGTSNPGTLSAGISCARSVCLANFAPNSIGACTACPNGTMSQAGASACTPFTCAIPTPTNGVASTGPGGCGSSQLYNSTCNSTCAVGFALTGPVLRCGGINAPVYTAQTCTAISCASMSANIVGSGSNPCSTARLSFNSSCTQSCASNFISTSTSTVSVTCGGTSNPGTLSTTIVCVASCAANFAPSPSTGLCVACTSGLFSLAGSSSCSTGPLLFSSCSASAASPCLSSFSLLSASAGSTSSVVFQSGSSTKISGNVGVSSGGGVSGLVAGVTLVGAAPFNRVIVADLTSQMVEAMQMVATANSLLCSTIPSELSGQVLTPGTYCCSSGAFTISIVGTLTLSSTPAAVGRQFVFRSKTFATGAASSIVTSGSALASDVFVITSGSVNIDMANSIVGTFISNGPSSISSGTKLIGRIIAQSSINVASSVVIVPV